MKKNLILLFFIVISLTISAQDNTKSKTEEQVQYQKYTYAYISIKDKALSKKKTVEVDLGDTPEQINEGKEYSEKLTNTTSIASVINYMAKNQFEFVEMSNFVYLYDGTGGTSRVVVVMRRKE